MQSNPLIVPLLHLLRTQPGPISEYDLMQLLEQSGVQFPIEAETRDLELFRKHFFLKNALYQLQAELIDEGMYVRIGMLDISLEPVSNGRDRQELSEQGEAKVRNYYLDWNNYSTTGDQEVKQLLQSFWERYFALDQYEQALQVLGMDRKSDWVDIQREYRRQATLHHPDKGGDQSRFIQIREAYETLRCYYQQ